MLCSLAALAPSAQVVLDGKFGASGPLSGPNYSIPASAGTTRGNNLFHSFSQFNIEAGGSATFAGPGNIQNILARVTGGTPSVINGAIRSEIGGANLYLLNPSGIMFGPGAAVDVSGSFAASSASYLRLADGARFKASLDADDSVLSSASVTAFGFLHPAPADVSIQGGTVTVPENRGIALLGGNLLLDGAVVRAPGGQIRFEALQRAGEVPALAALGSDPGGSIALLNRSSVDASGPSGGRVVIRGGKLTVDDSRIESNTQGAGEGQGIDIAVSGTVEVLRGGQINSLSPDALGPGGNVELTARVLRLDGGGLADDFDQPFTQISASSGNLLSEGAAKGGDVIIRAGRLELVNSARISSDSYGAGDAGRIQIQADTVLMDGKGNTVAQISTDSLGFQGGKGGDMTIRAGTIDLRNGANISSWTLGSAPAGLIDIEAGALNVLSGSYIGTPTLGQGQAGDIRITADRLRIEGEDTGIIAFTFPGESPASGGNMRIQAGLLEIDQGFISTASFGAGRGGNIDVSVRSLWLQNGATINAAGYGEGRAGNITIESTGPILLAAESSIDTEAPDSSGGNIDLRAGAEVQLLSSGISALAGLNGGNVSVASPSLVYLLGSTVTGQADATAAGSGNGGNLTFDAGQLVLNDSDLVSKSSFGNGGNITIRANQFLQSETIIDASAPFGLPGTVQVRAPELDLSAVYPDLRLNLLDPSTLLQPHCGVRLGGNLSSLIVRDRGGLPLAPEGFVPSAPLPAAIPIGPGQ